MAYEQLGAVDAQLNAQLKTCVDALPACDELLLTPGQQLLMQGQAQRFAYFIDSGVLVATHIDELGQEHYKEFYFSGELCFLYSAWITNSNAQYSIEVLQPAQVRRIAISTFAQPSWQAMVVKLLQQQVLYKEAKEAFLLLKTPQQRYQYLYTYRRHWLAQLSLTQVAKYLGISAVSLSRIRKRLGVN